MKYYKEENGILTIWKIHSTDDPEIVAGGWTLVPDHLKNIQNVTLVNDYYYNGTEIVKRPDRPCEECDWDTTTNSWVIDRDLINLRLLDHRRYLLLYSDWTQSVDAPLSDEKKAEWRVYRQALRDFPANNTEAPSFASLVWPTEPS